LDLHSTHVLDSVCVRICVHIFKIVAKADEDHPASTEQNSVSVPQAPTTGYGGKKTKEQGEEDRVLLGFVSR